MLSVRRSSCLLARSVASRLQLTSTMRAASSVASGDSQVPDTYYPHGISSLSHASTSMAECIRRLGAKENFKEESLVGPSKYVKAKTLTYELDEKARRWDAVQTYDSLGVVIYNIDLNSFLVVRQFRPPVYATACRQSKSGPTPDYEQGFTYELCAGLLDKAELSLEEVCSEEIAEECGYLVDPQQIQPIADSIASSGSGGSRHYMFYCEVNESMKMGANAGGGLVEHGEMIELLAVPRSSVMAFIIDPALKRSPGLQFGLLWAITQKK